MRRRLPPGPVFSPYEILWAQISRRPITPMQLLSYMPAFGDISYWSFGRHKLYFLAHPELIHQVFAENASRYRKHDMTQRGLRPFLGQGVLLAEGERHRSQRKMLQPAFHSRRIESYARVMVEHTHDLLAGWQVGEERDMAAELMRLTLRIVGKTLLGIDIAEGADQLGQLVTAMLRCTDEMLRSIVLLPDWVPTARVRRLRQTVAGMHEMVQRIIEERRRSGGDHGDLLSMLLLARDDAGAGMSDEQVRDEVLTMILAGHETTANTLAWALYLLSQNPAAGQALHAEVTTVLGDRAPTLADLPNLPLCEHVLKESLRLYPPAPVLSRQALADTEMVGGYAIDPEAMIVMSPYYMHRDPRFFIEPLRFWPERWAGGLERSLPRGCYFPFGDGPRICLGQQFAMLEARLVLATLVRRFRYTLPPGHQVEEEAAVTLRPRGGLRMRLGAETAPA